MSGDRWRGIAVSPVSAVDGRGTVLFHTGRTRRRERTGPRVVEAVATAGAVALRSAP